MFHLLKKKKKEKEGEKEKPWCDAPPSMNCITNGCKNCYIYKKEKMLKK